MNSFRRRAAAAGIFLISFLSFSLPAYAERPVVQATGAGRASLRAKDGVPSEFVTRVDLLLLPSDPHWNLAPFVEARYSFDDSDFSRVELGVEAGVKPFSWWADELSQNWYTRPLTWVYVGQSVYQRWLKPEISQTPAKSAETLEHIFPGATHTESESRLVLDIPLPWEVRSKPVGLYGFNEYIVDLNQGRAIRNEFGFGFNIPLPTDQPLDLFLGYRHVDLIHLNDTDQFEGGLKAKF